MRRYLAATFIGATLFLTGCSDTVGGQASQAQSSVSATVESTTPAPTTTQAPAPTTTQVPSGTTVFPMTQQQAVASLRAVAPVFSSSYSDAELISLFELACSDFDSGASIQIIILDGASEGFDPGDIGALLAASISSTCTEYLPMLQAFLDDPNPND